MPTLGLDVGTCLAFSQELGFMGSRASKGFLERTNSHCYLLLQSPIATSQVLRGPYSLPPPLGPFAPSEPSLLCEGAGKACSHYLGEKLRLERWCGHLMGPSWEGQEQPTPHPPPPGSHPLSLPLGRAGT